MDESYSPHPVRNNGVMTNWNDLSFRAVANQFLHFIGLEAMRQTMSSLFSGDISDLTLSSSLQSIALSSFSLYQSFIFLYGRLCNYANSTRDPFILYQESSITDAKSADIL